MYVLLGSGQDHDVNRQGGEGDFDRNIYRFHVDFGTRSDSEFEILSYTSAFGGMVVVGISYTSNFQCNAGFDPSEGSVITGFILAPLQQGFDGLLVIISFCQFPQDFLYSLSTLLSPVQDLAVSCSLLLRRLGFDGDTAAQ